MLYIEQNPLKAYMVKVKRLEYCLYSSFHYFLKDEIFECLQNAWIVKNHKEDKKEIKEMLHSSVDSAVLQELKVASSLVEVTIKSLILRDSKKCLKIVKRLTNVI